MEPDTLRRVGEALYGDRWQAPLAGDLRISERNLRYWLAGRHAVPPGVIGELRKLVSARSAELAALLEDIGGLADAAGG